MRAKESYGEALAEFLREQLAQDPRCSCGHQAHRHSDEGGCYDCRCEA